MAGLASMTLGDAYVNIMGETAGLQSSLVRAQTMMRAFVSSAGGTLAKGFALGIPTAVAGAMVYSVKSFMNAEVVSKKLAGAIAMAGGSVSALMPKYEKLADRISRVTKWDDEAVKSAMASALARGLSTEKMEEAIPAAVGLAARMGMDLNSAMNMVTRAGMGNTMMLQRYFPQLKNATTATEKWAMIMKLGAAGLKMSKGEIDTISGAFGQMRKAVGEVFESIGQGLVGSGAFKKTLQEIVDKIWALKDAIDKLVSSGKFQQWVDIITGTLKYMWNDLRTTGEIIWHALGDPLVRVGKYLIDILTALMNAVWELIKYTGTAMGSLANLIVSSIWEPIKWVVQNIGSIFKNLWANIKASAGSVWEWLKNPMAGWKAPKLIEVFGGTTSFDQALNVMRSSLDAFKSDVMSTSGLKGALQTVWGSISKNPFEGWWAGFEKILNAGASRERAISESLGKIGIKDYGEEEKKKPTVDTASKASFSIISMADQWKKLQEGISKNKDEKEIRDATKETAKHTKRMADFWGSWQMGTQNPGLFVAGV